MNTSPKQADVVCQGADRRSSSVALAALMLPGLAMLAAAAPGSAVAETAPEKSTIAIKYGDYRDWQPGWDRVRVKAPHLYVQMPVAGEWSVEGAVVGDSVSGATPRMHTQRSGASNMSDYRRAGELRVTRYLSRAAVSAGFAYSKENDYDSRALSVQARWSSDDNNRTWSVGLGGANDKIDNQHNGVNTAINQRKQTREVMAGVTQVLTPVDIVQANLTRSVGQGYFNDPYKSFDQRPDQRNAWIGLIRWNHHLVEQDATVRSSYRHYRDTFGVRSHTVDAEWVKRLNRWTLSPGLRYYSQSAANFYFDPVFNAQGGYDEMGTIVRAATLQGNKSADQRLAGFGAVTASIKVAYAFNPDTVVDFKVESYKQTASLKFGGSGSPGLDPFNARFYQIGLTQRF